MSRPAAAAAPCHSARCTSFPAGSSLHMPYHVSGSCDGLSHTIRAASVRRLTASTTPTGLPRKSVSRTRSPTLAIIPALLPRRVEGGEGFLLPRAAHISAGGARVLGARMFPVCLPQVLNVVHHCPVTVLLAQFVQVGPLKKRIWDDMPRAEHSGLHRPPNHPLQRRGATGGGDEGGGVVAEGGDELRVGLGLGAVRQLGTHAVRRVDVDGGLGSLPRPRRRLRLQLLQPRPVRLGQSRAHRAALREFGRSEARSIPNAAASKSACISVHFSACPLSRSPP